MNIELNNRLVKAIEFLHEDERKYVSQIDKYNSQIAKIKKRNEGHQSAMVQFPHPMTPAQVEKKQLTSMILLLLFVWPVGIPYAIYFACTKNKREKKNNNKYVAEMKEYENKQQHIKTIINQGNKEIEEIKMLISQVITQRKAYYQTYGACVQGIPERYCTVKDVEAIYFYVHSGISLTLSDAINHHAQDIQELIELRQRIEEKEEAERREEHRHRELIKRYDDNAYQLKRVADAQNQTNEQLEKIHQDNLRNQR